MRTFWQGRRAIPTRCHERIDRRVVVRLDIGIAVVTGIRQHMRSFVVRHCDPRRHRLNRKR